MSSRSGKNILLHFLNIHFLSSGSSLIALKCRMEFDFHAYFSRIIPIVAYFSGFFLLLTYFDLHPSFLPNPMMMCWIYFSKSHLCQQVIFCLLKWFELFTLTAELFWDFSVWNVRIVNILVVANGFFKMEDHLFWLGFDYVALHFWPPGVSTWSKIHQFSLLIIIG